MRLLLFILLLIKVPSLIAMGMQLPTRELPFVSKSGPQKKTTKKKTTTKQTAPKDVGVPEPVPTPQTTPELPDRSTETMLGKSEVTLGGTPGLTSQPQQAEEGEPTAVSMPEEPAPAPKEAEIADEVPPPAEEPIITEQPPTVAVPEVEEEPEVVPTYQPVEPVPEIEEQPIEEGAIEEEEEEPQEEEIVPEEPEKEKEELGIATEEQQKITTEEFAEEEPVEEVTEEPPVEEAAVEQQTEVPEVPEAPILSEPVLEPTPEEPTEEEAPDVAEIKGIDTLDMDEPKGNWLLKRVWWERAERGYEKVKQTTQRVFDSRATFFKKRADIDKNVLDPFYVKVGVGQGELQEIIESLLSSLEIARKEEGSLSPERRAFLQTVEAEKETLKNLETRIQETNRLDNAIDDALSQLMDQINRARAYEQEAWETFKKITRALSDKKARELYFSLDNSRKNIAAIGNYITTQFSPYFDDLLQKTRTIVDQMQTTIQELKAKGVDLKQKAQKLTKQEQEEEQQRLARERRKAAKEAAEVKEKPATWTSQLYEIWQTFVDGVGTTWGYFTNLFGSKPVSESEGK